MHCAGGSPAPLVGAKEGYFAVYCCVFRNREAVAGVFLCASRWPAILSFAHCCKSALCIAVSLKKMYSFIFNGLAQNDLKRFLLTFSQNMKQYCEHNMHYFPREAHEEPICPLFYRQSDLFLFPGYEVDTL